MRNRDMKILLTCLIVTTTLGTAICFVINQTAGIVALVMSALFLVTTIVSQLYRYRQIEHLTNYLERISKGEYTLDIRDNDEGELSILKNELHNLTVVLSTQAELMQKDKVYLADALSDISHQLKTPLTSMFMMTDLLSGELNTEKRVAFTQTIRKQLERIEWLVTSLLKLSKLDAGTIAFRSDEVWVHDVIEQATAPLRIPIELKQQNLAINGDPSVVFKGDLNWTVEAVINVLKNCIEHTPTGGTLNISFEGNPLHTQIVISDNGEGISREDLPYIFKRFYKGKNASDDSVGIGLAMSRSIMLRQNGDIAVQSKPGQGTTFTIKIIKCVI